MKIIATVVILLAAVIGLDVAVRLSHNVAHQLFVFRLAVVLRLRCVLVQHLQGMGIKRFYRLVSQLQFFKI